MRLDFSSCYLSYLSITRYVLFSYENVFYIIYLYNHKSSFILKLYLLICSCGRFRYWEALSCLPITLNYATWPFQTAYVIFESICNHVLLDFFSVMLHNVFSYHRAYIYDTLYNESASPFIPFSYFFLLVL